MKRKWKIFFGLGASGFGFSLIALLILSVWVIPFKKIQFLKNGHVERGHLGEKTFFKVVSHKPKSWVSLKEISPLLVRSVLIREDASFYKHRGIDFSQIRVAIQDHLFRGKNLRGASTITQQVSKNIFLTHERSFWRKTKEAIISLYMERLLTKNKILEVYLNLAQWGEKFYGIKQASYFYFNKSPKKLNGKEAALLAILLPSPKKYGTFLKRGKLSPYLKRTAKNLLGKLKRDNHISKEQYHVYLQSHPYIDKRKVLKSTKVKEENSLKKRVSVHPLLSMKGAPKDLGRYSVRPHFKELQDPSISGPDNLEEDMAQIQEEFSME